MRKIKIIRYEQESACCSIAAVSSISNYFNNDINYDLVKSWAIKHIKKEVDQEGLLTGEICRLFNFVGFEKVTLINNDILLFDYQWSGYNRNDMISVIKEALLIKDKKDKTNNMLEIYKWYKNRKYNNFIKIDYEFGKYIKKFLLKGIPIMLTFNWNMFFKFPKFKNMKEIDPFNGEYEYHAVVLNGFDNKGVWVVDSNVYFHKYSRKKYSSGFYRMNWDNLFCCIGQGDIIAAEKYIKK